MQYDTEWRPNEVRLLMESKKWKVEGEEAKYL